TCPIFLLERPDRLAADLLPFMDFRVAVCKRQTTGPVVIAGRQIPPMFIGSRMPWIVHEQGIRDTVRLLINNYKYINRTRLIQIIHFLGRAASAKRAGPKIFWRGRIWIITNDRGP